MKTKVEKGCLRFESVLVFFAIFFLCSFFLLAGFFGSIIISQDGKRVGPRHQLLESMEVEENGFISVPHGKTGDSSIYSIPFQVLSWSPRAFYFPNFATAEQCQSIMKIANSTLKPSKVALRKGDTPESVNGLRTSSGTFIKASDDSTGVLDYIEKKIARATMLPRSNGESFNVLRYEVGQRYVPHHDAFDPAHYGPQYNQRVASFLVYLTDVEEGGETAFPYENDSNKDIVIDYNGCLGLKVKPRQGDGLLFFSLLPNGTIDKKSLHGSCPVIKGEKWVATKWIHNTNFS
ncbi:hypothetical protein M9H77_20502 [Catharanthus roseus]|uniref:Uncharacterized protein n=1 Tax=Catharanthus roseus TaxID=4058 RepID=A0ACC0AK36_CATRO|nr:hypothetical protein M9H77_20502 [Catharanthus roseus]